MLVSCIEPPKTIESQVKLFTASVRSNCHNSGIRSGSSFAGLRDQRGPKQSTRIELDASNRSPT